MHLRCKVICDFFSSFRIVNLSYFELYFIFFFVNRIDCPSSSRHLFCHLVLFFHEFFFNFIPDENASLVVPLQEEQFLFKFLRPCKYNVQDARKKIIKYYSYQLTYPEIFSSIITQSIYNILNEKILFISSDCAVKTQQHVILFSVGRWNVDSMSFDSIVNTFNMIIELLSLKPLVQENGVIAIIDTSDVSWSQIKSFGPYDAKKVITLVEEVIPCNITNIHVLNRGHLAKMAAQVIKPFLNPDLTSRCKLHSDSDSLINSVGSNVLPCELGGDVSSNNPSYWLEQLQSNRQLFSQYWSENTVYGFPNNSTTTTTESNVNSTDDNVSGHNFIRQFTGRREPLMENLPKLPSCVTSFFR